jgi:flagellar assembly protein FliH
MMNFSFSEGVTEAGNHVFQVPITSYLYRDINTPVETQPKENRPPQPSAEQDDVPQAPPGLSAQEVEEQLIRARAEATAETEKRLRDEYEARSQKEKNSVRQALDQFQGERKTYFARVESEVVHLALAIAAKILHREAQVDSLLVAALVHVAVDKLHDGSSVTVRVSPAKAEKWRASLATPKNGSTIALVEDTNLDPEDCMLETDMGTANFSIDAQLKEVEQGFFDLLAQRPPVK